MSMTLSAKLKRNSSQNEDLCMTLDNFWLQKNHIDFNSRNKTSNFSAILLIYVFLVIGFFLSFLFFFLFFTLTYTSLDLADILLSNHLWAALPYRSMNPLEFTYQKVGIHPVIVRNQDWQEDWDIWGALRRKSHKGFYFLFGEPVAWCYVHP